MVCGGRGDGCGGGVGREGRRGVVMEEVAARE
jgi:hypothetical protein